MAFGIKTPPSVNGKSKGYYKDLAPWLQENQVEFIDLKFIDLPGQWQHYTLHASEFGPGFINSLIAFDGSSIRGFQEIHESDMALRIDPSTAFIDPFMDDPTVSFICNVLDPITRTPYSRDPRWVARKAENYLRASGVATISYWGPEAEFYVFDEIRYDSTNNRAFYEVDSSEGAWNTARKEGPNLGSKIRLKGGYFPVPPLDSLHNLRSKMVSVMRSIGVPAELHHHEVGTAGQSEIGVRFNTMVASGDDTMKYKYVVKNVARRYGKTATFMPKPLWGDNGSGMHVHQSLWKEDRNLFWEQGRYADLSQLAEWYIGGLLRHAPSLLAFCAPSTNSYRRLVPGYEAPINLIYSQRNRSACIRIPLGADSPKSKRFEFRCPDPSANPYLAFAACLMAGLDGIRKRIEPPAPIDRDLYELSPAEAAHIASTPGSLEGALNALERDHDYLLEGDVFTPDLIEHWLAYKRKTELDGVRLRPHPYEFALYYDC